MSGGFTALLCGPLPERSVLGALFARMLDVPLDDAAKIARTSWGVLGENLPEDVAKSYAECARRSGMEAVVVPSEMAASIPPAAQIKKAQLSPEGISCETAGARLAAPWKSVYLVAAAPVKNEQRSVTKTETKGPPDAARLAGMAIGIMTIGMPINVGGKKQQETRETVHLETVFTLDIFSDSPCPRLRIIDSGFDFSLLGAQKTYSSQANFRLLALQVASSAPGAARNAGITAMAEGKILSTLAYDSSDLYEKELRRLYLLHKAAK